MSAAMQRLMGVVLTLLESSMPSQQQLHLQLQQQQQLFVESVVELLFSTANLVPALPIAVKVSKA
jgi:hypothetical protein